MKRNILLILSVFLLLFNINFISCAYDVSETVRIGIKYGSSAAASSKVTSSNGFVIRAEGTSSKEIATISQTSVTVDSYNNSGLNSYLVVEQTGFPSLEQTLLYCQANSYTTVPYYKNGVFYAVREGLYTYNDALLSQNQAKLTNVTAYIIEPDSSRVRLTDTATGKCILIFSQNDGEILGLCGINEALLSFGSEETYRDTMEFKRVSNSLYLINNISMQHYLYSVVTAEIGATAPLEAQKAQAICARTYTEQNLSRHSSDGFNLCASVHCQAYIGTKWERDQALKAVDETDNMIMTYNDKPISAVYFAHSGGRTANVEDVWGSPYPYLKSVEDAYCTDYTWEYEIDYNDLTEKMKNKGYNIGTVTDVRVTEATDYGLVKKLTITGTNGSKVFERESARTILGLKSQVFSIPSSDLTYSVKDSTGVTTKNITTALTANGIVTLGDSVKVKDGNSKTTTLTAGSGNIIYGKGYGHHVGMSQHGAMEYAKAGWTYDKILKHYYKGITITGE